MHPGISEEARDAHRFNKMSPSYLSMFSALSKKDAAHDSWEEEEEGDRGGGGKRVRRRRRVGDRGR